MKTKTIYPLFFAFSLTFFHAASANELTPTPSLISSPPSLTQNENAQLHLGMIRDELENVEERRFFSRLLSSENNLQSSLLQEIDLFLTIYSNLEIAAEALLFKGELLFKLGKEDAAGINWLQVLYEFPSSEAAKKSRRHLTTLLEHEWQSLTNDINPILNNIPDGSRPERISTLINKLYIVENRNLTQALMALQYDYLKRFPQSLHADEVQTLLAHNLGAESAKSGIFAFKKFLALYPHSSYRPEAMLAIADLQRIRLQQFEEAATNYQALIQKHPKHQLTKHAYLNLALTYETHLSDYANALKTLNTIVENYPTDKSALSALQHIADIQENTTNEPTQAIITLRKIAAVFKGEAATDALDTAISIAQRTLKDAALTAEIQEQLITDFPEYDAAPDTLFELAEYYEQSLQNKPKAQQLYQRFMAQYPDHRLARKVQERL